MRTNPITGEQSEAFFASSAAAPHGEGVAVAEIFRRYGYVSLPEFLAPESCTTLTAALRDLVEHGGTRHDEQCPKSEGVHGAAVFDFLLEQLLPHVQEASGKRLFPTYAYARLYKPGEVLKPHTDRPACEISVTLCLGFEGEPWPIYMADGEIDSPVNAASISMKPGDAVLYRGCDKVHWREAYSQGPWLAQVFLHYVDADGPHAGQKFDGRGRLTHHNSRSDYFFAVPDAVPVDACRKIIEGCEKAEGEQAQVGAGGEGKVDKSIRDVKRYNLPIHRGIGATMAGVGLLANREQWRFDVGYANQCEFLRYDQEGHYHGHVDTFLNRDAPECRKLTVLLFLNDDFEGGRFFLQPEHRRIYPPQAPGTALVFPSFLLHGVEPVTSGIRRSLVTWLVGPWFR